MTFILVEADSILFGYLGWGLGTKFDLLILSQDWYERATDRMKYVTDVEVYDNT